MKIIEILLTEIVSHNLFDAFNCVSISSGQNIGCRSRKDIGRGRGGFQIWLLLFPGFGGLSGARYFPLEEANCNSAHILWKKTKK